MKQFKLTLLCLVGSLFLTVGTTNGQAIKMNIPLALAATPNIGFEYTLSRQFSLNADVLWAPYLFKKDEEVFRSLISSIDLRYYVNPKYYYTNEMYDGFYIGPYAMYGNFNIGLKNKTEGRDSYRYAGWGLSGGVSTGYKFFVSDRLRLDVNIGIGVAHLQYDKFLLGGENADYPLARKETMMWIGPTKFGVHLVYNIFR